jgi:hypothetical protein
VTTSMLGAWRRRFVVLVGLLYMGLATPALAQRPAPVYHVNLANGITPPAAAFAGRALQEAVAAAGGVMPLARLTW